MARLVRSAATLESTPPERPQTTRLFPTLFRISSVMEVTHSPRFQVGSQRQTLKRKLLRISRPPAVCTTSG
jgi:hypothetical protein